MLVGLGVTRAATCTGVGTSVTVAGSGSGSIAGSVIGSGGLTGSRAVTRGVDTVGRVGAGTAALPGAAETDTDSGVVCGWGWPVARMAPVAITISPSTATGPSTHTRGSSP